MNILDAIGNTPLIELGRKGNSGLYAKLEYCNPGGSVKDRAALYLLKDAVEKNDKDTVYIEATSGNTGIGLALVAKMYGLKLVITMPENASVERRRIIKALGAEVVLTGAALGMQGAVDEADALRKTFVNARIVGQFDNPANIRAHYETTAPEIIRQLPDVDWVVSAVGSGGTIMGIKKYFLDNKIQAKVCAAEPFGSPVLSGGKAGKHNIPGIGAGFVPSILDIKLLDKIITVKDAEAKEGARELASVYGVMGGFSAGAAYVAACKLAEEVKGKIAFIVPDSSARYLSTDLYE